MKDKIEIKPGMRFRDPSGCLIEVTRIKSDKDVWCKGVPDVIGEFLYSKSTVLKGLED